MQRFISLEEYNVGEVDGHLAVTGPSLDRAADIANQLMTGKAKLGFVGQRQVLVVPVDLAEWTMAEVAKAIGDVEDEEEMGDLSDMRKEEKAALYAEMGRRVEAVQPSSNSSLIPPALSATCNWCPPCRCFPAPTATSSAPPAGRRLGRSAPLAGWRVVAGPSPWRRSSET